MSRAQRQGTHGPLQHKRAIRGREIRLEETKVVGSRVLLRDKGYGRAERPLSYTVALHPWGGPGKTSLDTVSSRTAVGPPSSKEAPWGSRRE